MTIWITRDFAIVKIVNDKANPEIIRILIETK